MQPKCRLSLGPPVKLVRLYAAKEVKLPHSKVDCVLEHRKHQMGPWTEIREFRIKALQIAKYGVAIEEALNNRKCAALQPQAVQPQTPASEQSWSGCPVELSYAIIMKNSGLPCNRPSCCVEAEQIVQELRESFGDCHLYLTSSCFKQP